MNRAGLATVRGAQLVNIRGWNPDKHTESVFTQAWRFAGPREIDLVPGERLVLATRMHWCIPLKTTAKSLVAMPIPIIVSFLLNMLAMDLWQLQVALWVGTVGHQCHMGYKVLGWRVHLLVVTDRRIIKTQGIFTCTMDEIVLDRITNLQVHQSFPGKVFRFGQFRIEAAGVHDDGAQRELIKYIPDPFTVHRAVRSGWLPGSGAAGR